MLDAKWDTDRSHSVVSSPISIRWFPAGSTHEVKRAPVFFGTLMVVFLGIPGGAMRGEIEVTKGAVTVA